LLGIDDRGIGRPGRDRVHLGIAALQYAVAVANVILTVWYAVVFVPAL